MPILVNFVHVAIVGQRSELRGAPHPFSQKSGTPLPFQKISYKVKNQPKSAKNDQNREKLLLEAKTI
jgi:hypothetical protein